MDTDRKGPLTDTDIKELLLREDYEHPFRWDPNSALKVVHETMISDINYSFTTNVMDIEFPYEYLMLYILKSYEHGMLSQYDEGLQSIQVLENKLDELSSDSSEDDTCRLAFLHIAISTKSFLLALSEDVDAASKALFNIPERTKMGAEEKAALVGLRGLFYGGYGLEGFKKASELFSDAIQISPDQSEWHFFKGKYLSRLRHIERYLDLPSREEKYHLELALDRKKKAMYVLYVAQLYRETAKRIYLGFIDNPENYDHIDNREDSESYCVEEARRFNEKAFKLYKESLVLKPECPETLIRCAKGFILFPPPLRDKELSKQLFDKALKLAPNSIFGHHAMAQYYGKCGNLEKAIEHLKICKEEKLLVAVMDMIRLEHRLDQKINVAQRLEALLNEYDSRMDRCIIFGQLASYHLFFFNDLHKACHYAREVCRLDGNYKYLSRHLPIVGIGTSRVITLNLNEILMDEVKCALFNSTLTEEEEEYFKEFLENISHLTDKCDSFMDERPQCLKRKIIQKSLDGYRFPPKKIENKNETRVVRENVSRPTKFNDESQESRKTDASLSWRKTSKGPKTAIKNPGFEKF